MASGSKTRNEKHEIFVSYVREDQALASSLVQKLEDKGWSVFWDLSIRKGERWRKKLQTKLDEVHCVLVIWSQHAEQSDYVPDEAEWARNNKTYFGIVTGDMKRPPLGFGEYEYLVLDGPMGDPHAGDYNRLLADIDAFIEESRQRKQAAQWHSSVTVPDPVLGDYEKRLVKKVNRNKQMGKIRELRLGGQRRAVFLFYCRSDDWPAALAGHLAGEDCADDTPFIWRLKSGYRQRAFRIALEEESDLHIRGKLMVVALTVNPKDYSVAEIRDFLQGTVACLASPATFNDDRCVYVLFACMSGNGLGGLRRWRLRRGLSGLKGVHCEWLEDLGMIESAHVIEWANGFEARYRALYDTEGIKDEGTRENILPPAVGRPHLPLGRDLNKILARNRR